MIELLVVISIVALLMAILMPCLQRVRKQAKVVQCQANLRQWGLLWETPVAEDADAQREGGNVVLSRSWVWGLYGPIQESPHADSTLKTIAYCPLATELANDQFNDPAGGTFRAYGYRDHARGFGRGSYGVNVWIRGMSHSYRIKTGPYNEDEQTRLWTGTNTKSPASIPAILDSTWPYGVIVEEGPPPPFDAVPTAPGGVNTPSGVPGQNSFCINRHDGHVNGVFFDWSLRKVGLKELWTLKWHRQFNTAGNWTKAGGVQPEDWPVWMRKFKDY